MLTEEKVIKVCDFGIAGICNLTNNDPTMAGINNLKQLFRISKIYIARGFDQKSTCQSEYGCLGIRDNSL